MAGYTLLNARHCLSFGKHIDCLSGHSCGGLWTAVRFASKRSGGSTKNQGKHAPGKHRGWKYADGQQIQPGAILVTQNNMRFHPGLNVGIGKNLTLFAMEPGRVVVTCEKIEPNWDDSWVKLFYQGRRGQVIYKKFFNIIPTKQHCHFKLVRKV